MFYLCKKYLYHNVKIYITIVVTFLFENSKNMQASGKYKVLKSKVLKGENPHLWDAVNIFTGILTEMIVNKLIVK